MKPETVILTTLVVAVLLCLFMIFLNSGESDDILYSLVTFFNSGND